MAIGRRATLTPKKLDERYMRIALEEAERAAQQGEVPVGAVLTKEGKVLARDHNRCIELNDPSAHAEVLVLRKAGEVLRNYRLNDTTLYVTAEPCPKHCASYGPNSAAGESVDRPLPMHSEAHCPHRS